MNALERIVEQARKASPNDLIELRDAIAGHGSEAVEAMAEWLADPVLTRFAVRVMGRVADLGHRDKAVTALRQAREEATPDQRVDIDRELARLGDRSSRRASATDPGKRPVDSDVPGWMMRTDRNNAEWLWSEVECGRLRQGWGAEPPAASAGARWVHGSR